MKNKVCILMLCLVLVGCSKSPSNSGQKSGPEEIVPGGYYSFVSVEGDYKVLKVLLVEDDVVHFCYYNNVFQNRPSESVISSLFFGKKQHDTFIDVDGGQQTTGRKHIALEIEGWGDLKPQFIVNEEVFPDELEAYEEWKTEDRYVCPSGTTIAN